MRRLGIEILLVAALAPAVPPAVLATKVELEAAVTSPNGRIRQVDFLGEYEDVNLEGDGVYRQWHCHYVRAVLSGQLGTVTAAPWKLVWDTSWVPDQPQPLRLAARIVDETGLTYFTEAVEGLTLTRDGLSVELCQPYEVPKKWVTRSGENVLKTGLTPKRNGKMVHGMEVNWPGIMVLIQYQQHPPSPRPVKGTPR